MKSQDQDYHLEYLPNSLRDILSVIGPESLRDLVDSFGGRAIYVPKKMSEGHCLARKLGIASALRLSKEFGGLQISIPLAKNAIRKLRNQEIIQARAEKWSVAEIAGYYQMTERQVWNILAKAKARSEDTW